jgi:hypothetical protein
MNLLSGNLRYNHEKWMLAGLVLRLLWFRRDRQIVEDERKGLRGEPPFGGASSFAGLGVPLLSGHVADLYGFFAWR